MKLTAQLKFDKTLSLFVCLLLFDSILLLEKFKNKQSLYFQSGRSISKLSSQSLNEKKSTNSSTASSPDLTAHAHIRSPLSEASDASSFTSEDLELPAANYVDSDTGLESMSSAETTAKPCSVCNDRPCSVSVEPNMDDLVQEVRTLKCDKLELLKQNVVRIQQSRLLNTEKYIDNRRSTQLILFETTTVD